MPILEQVVSRLTKFPELAKTINLTQLESFLRQTSRLLPIIRSDEVNKRCTYPAEMTLPVSVVDFLAGTLQLPGSTVILCWAGFGDLAGETSDLLSDDEAFGSMGPGFGIGGSLLHSCGVINQRVCRRHTRTSHDRLHDRHLSFCPPDQASRIWSYLIHTTPRYTSCQSGVYVLSSYVPFLGSRYPLTLELQIAIPRITTITKFETHPIPLLNVNIMAGYLSTS